LPFEMIEETKVRKLKSVIFTVKVRKHKQQYDSFNLIQ
jgi:hypothetical protein